MAGGRGGAARLRRLRRVGVMRRRGRPRGTGALSDWEVDELLMHARRGWTYDALANYYRVSVRTVARIMRAERSGPILASRGGKVD